MGTETVSGRSGILDVTVVIPFYNAHETLQRALESIASQSVLPSSVIIVNDGSGGVSIARLKRVLSAWHVVPARTLWLPTNVGPAGARNAGWALASTKYVAFLDADDAWAPRKLASQVAYLESDPDCVLVGGLGIMKQHGEGEHGDESPTGWREVGRNTLLFRNAFNTSSVVIRRQTPMRFDGSMRYCEDYDLWLRLAHSRYRLVANTEGATAEYFKPIYGALGQSRELSAMRGGQVSCYRHLHAMGHLSALSYGIMIAWANVAYLRRRIICASRRLSAHAWRG
jgi:glycosyltransferase involved in cell wall biosynthesis